MSNSGRQTKGGPMAGQTHLTLKDVDGIETAEQLEALKDEKGINKLSPNAGLLLFRKGVLKEIPPAE